MAKEVLRRSTNLAAYKLDLRDTKDEALDNYTSFNERGESSQFTFSHRTDTDMSGFSKTNSRFTGMSNSQMSNFPSHLPKRDSNKVSIGSGFMSKISVPN
jgi:hypothetical protein